MQQTELRGSGAIQNTRVGNRNTQRISINQILPFIPKGTNTTGGGGSPAKFYEIEQCHPTIPGVIVAREVSSIAWDYESNRILGGWSGESSINIFVGINCWIPDIGYCIPAIPCSVLFVDGSNEITIGAISIVALPIGPTQAPDPGDLAADQDEPDLESGCN